MTYIPGMMKFQIINKVTEVIVDRICDDLDTIGEVVNIIKEVKNRLNN